MPKTLNVARLHEATLDDAEFMSELVEMFLADAADQLKVLENAVDREDLPSARRTAHRLRGACRNVGVDQLAELCEAIERREEPEASVDLYPVLREFEKAAAALQECVIRAKTEAR